MTLFAIFIGMGLVAMLGLFHQRALLALDRLTGPDDVDPNGTMAAIFVGLLIIHVGEALMFAGAYGVCLRIDAFGGLEGTQAPGWSDLVYFSLINFTTVGYTQLTATGALRMLSALESLGGLMVLTWSATYIYSAWQGREAARGVRTWGSK